VRQNREFSQSFKEMSNKRISYSACDKLKIINFALLTNQTKAAVKFGIHKSMVSRWLKDLRKIKRASPQTRRIGSGRRPYKNLKIEYDEELNGIGNENSGGV
jgi:transposase-like protein